MIKQFIKCIKTPLSILLFETRINVDPHTDIEIPGYTRLFTFPHLLTIAGGVSAYFSNLVTFIEIELKLQMRGCKVQWFEVKFSGGTDKYIIAVIYRHPWDNVGTFSNSLDEKLQILNKKRSKVILMGDINIDLKCDSSLKSEYLHMIESNASSSLITPSPLLRACTAPLSLRTSNLG